MSSKFRKTIKVLPNIFMVLGAVAIALSMMLSLVNLPVQAQTGNTDCPDGWVYKVNVGGANEGTKPDGLNINIDGKTVTFNMEVKFCVKAANTNSGIIIGTSYTVNFTGPGGQIPDISHVSIYEVIQPTPDPTEPTPTEPTPTEPTPTEPTPTEPTPTEPTPTEPTPTEPTATPADPSPTPDPSEIPADPSPTPDPSVTPEPSVTPDPTEDPDEPTPVPTYSPPSSSDNSAVLIPVTGIDFGTPMNKVQSVALNLGLGLLGLGMVLQAIRKKIK